MEEESDTIIIEAEEKIPGGWRYVVVIGEEPDTTKHTVTVDEEYWEVFSEIWEEPHDFVIGSFDFLLRHESKEMILPDFNLEIIPTYFPEYEEEMMAATPS